MAAGTLAPGVMSTSIAAAPIMTSTALLAGKLLSGFLLLICAVVEIVNSDSPNPNRC